MHPHLTNTSFHTAHGEKGVRLLSELIGSTVLSSPHKPKLTESDISGTVDQIVQILGQAFQAALASPVHFQVNGLSFFNLKY